MNRNELIKKIENRIATANGTISIVAKNLDSLESFAWNENIVFYSPASTIKLPILCAAYYWARKGVISLDQKVTVHEKDRVGGCGVLFEFDEGLTPTLHDLMRIMIVVSDNMATNLVMETVGKNRIQQFLVETGLDAIRAERKMLDPEGMRLGQINCVTARALAEILEGLANHTLLDPQDCEDAIEILLRQQINTKLPAKVIERWDLVFNRSTIRIAHKTGDMPEVEHDIGIIFMPNTKFVLAVLTENIDNDLAIEFISDTAKDFVDYFA